MKKRACKNPECNEFVDYWGQKFYCSNACRQRAFRLRHGADKSLVTDGTKSVKKRCLNCGREFWSAQPKAKYCKTSCRVSHFNQVKRMKAQGIIDDLDGAMLTYHEQTHDQSEVNHES